MIGTGAVPLQWEPMHVNLTFVLIGTTHTGNIGAAARAMKTMGYASLRLVDACSHRTDEAKARASGADDVLMSAERFDSLEDAVADCHAVIGTSARPRNLAVPMLSSRDLPTALNQISTEDAAVRVALVFGRERSGLNNQELDRCTHLVQIPVNPDFSSLNLGSAVQVLAYECSTGLHDLRDTTDEMKTSVASDSAAMERLFAHLERVLLLTGFLDPDNPKHLMRRFRHYFERNRPDEAEMNVWRGLLSSVERPISSEQRNSADIGSGTNASAEAQAQSDPEMRR